MVVFCWILGGICLNAEDYLNVCCDASEAGGIKSALSIAAERGVLHVAPRRRARKLYDPSLYSALFSRANFVQRNCGRTGEASNQY